MEYEDFIKSKVKYVKDCGFDISDNKLNDKLFDFQKHIVKIALKKGRYALFEDCGLGKTIQQLEWANQVLKKYNKPVLIVAPLGVSFQTISEGNKFGYDIKRLNDNNYGNNIYITNYERLEKYDLSRFNAVVLDESSILKNFTGKYKNLLIKEFKNVPYKLCCTATPSPNDLNEIGNHSEFLNIMNSTDMRMRWFIRDEGMNNYRLKRHAESEFYGWIGSFASVLRSPSDIGYSDEGYILPPLNFNEIKLQVQTKTIDKLFDDSSINATDFNRELRRTMNERLGRLADEINLNEQNIIWVKQNEEADYLKKLLPDAVEVRGSDSVELKEERLLSFAKGEFKILITKSKIAQFGMNFQSCNNQWFPSLDFSFESLYQSIRRSYRFGQKKPVNINIITTNTMENVIKTIKRKQNDYNKMFDEISKNVNKNVYKNIIDYKPVIKQDDEYKLILGDCVEEIKNIPDDSIDFSIFSPPFSNLFTYSDNLRDMGNNESNEDFFIQYGFLIKELYRVLKPGRLIAVHTKDLAVYKNSDGYSGMYDFTGRNHRLLEEFGFKYHCKITIWIDPVLEMQRTKTQRLLYKQVTSDSTYSGVGMPEYITVFRKWGDEDEFEPVNFLNKNNFDLDKWQKWASPVWFDIKRTNVLSNFKNGKEQKDEKHICPLQLDVIERCISLWSNENETVFSPFAGIGSEGYMALKLNRKFIGIELKESYYKQALNNLENIIEQKKQVDLFSEIKKVV